MVNDMVPPSSELPTKPYHVVLSLSSLVEGELSEQELLIGGLTSEEGRGIFQLVSAELLRIAGRVRSNGGS